MYMYKSTSNRLVKSFLLAKYAWLIIPKNMYKSIYNRVVKSFSLAK
jgi:hypothetical protein